MYFWYINWGRRIMSSLRFFRKFKNSSSTEYFFDLTWYVIFYEIKKPCLLRYFSVKEKERDRERGERISRCWYWRKSPNRSVVHCKDADRKDWPWHMYVRRKPCEWKAPLVEYISSKCQTATTCFVLCVEPRQFYPSSPNETSLRMKIPSSITLFYSQGSAKMLQTRDTWLCKKWKIFIYRSIAALLVEATEIRT